MATARPFSARSDRAAGERGPVADADVQRGLLRRPRDPVQPADGERRARFAHRAVRDVDDVGGGVLRGHVPGPAAQAESRALADGVEPEAAVAAEDAPALALHDVARTLAEVGPNELRVADLAEKADALAVGPVPAGEAEAARGLAHLALAHRPDREERAAELGAAQVREEVGLVLHAIGRAPEDGAGRRLLDDRVVSGRHAVAGVLQGLQERAELDALVAEDVRARRVAEAQLLDRVGDDPLVVFALHGHHVQRNARLLAHGARVAQVLLPRAASERGEIVLEPDLEIEGRQVGMPRGLEHVQGHRTVDAAGKQHRDLHKAKCDRLRRGWATPSGRGGWRTRRMPQPGVLTGRWPSVLTGLNRFPSADTLSYQMDAPEL